MHEMSIAMAVLEAARIEAQRHAGARVSKVGVRVGEWAGVDPEALRFSFDALVAGNEPAPPALDIQFCPRKNRCCVCGATFAVKDYEIQCPDCGQELTEPVGGGELELAYVEMEDL